MYKLISKNHILIGTENIVFPDLTLISKVEEMKNVVCFNTRPSEENLNWNEVVTHEIWKKRCHSNPSELYCYNSEGKLIWKFSEYPVIGFGIVNTESKSKEDFVSNKHFIDYIEKFNNLEVLEVYAGDYRYMLDHECPVLIKTFSIG